MDFPALKSIIEGLLFLSGEEGLGVKQLSEIVDQRPEVVTDALEELKREYTKQGRGLQILKIAGNYQMGTLPEHAVYFEKLAYSPSRSSLSQAALETLSIIAYRQPITRVEIEEIRGVKAERALHTLTSKDLIEEVGRAEAIGRPILYGTTKAFLDYFGLGTIKDLPEPSVFEDSDPLEEETQLLFSKLGQNMFEEESSSEVPIDNERNRAE
ncbi:MULTISPECIES: SMC-Scp complex subunit ScpB [unclassified Paenibacillus]|uniref:Segregation and condensation protein B n=1 Tax=Paenibacillus provencensis TaxID=441151 RepID=A0ABW3PQD4_9BACL|nr:MULTISPECIES: SMC-Scp complex subunit ScpB [unclassified Paenibacillus]MCM3126515.1 SMC-Scp complex subunit ScpB [Paenibacillus sp. MER 78]SFS59657.1 segregation and condensation protein B [Paenibacillus sp. 453mf]